MNLDHYGWYHVFMNCVDRDVLKFEQLLLLPMSSVLMYMNYSLDFITYARSKSKL